MKISKSGVAAALAAVLAVPLAGARVAEATPVAVASRVPLTTALPPAQLSAAVTAAAPRAAKAGYGYSFPWYRYNAGCCGWGGWGGGWGGWGGCGGWSCGGWGGCGGWSRCGGWGGWGGWRGWGCCGGCGWGGWGCGGGNYYPGYYGDYYGPYSESPYY